MPAYNSFIQKWGVRCSKFSEDFQWTIGTYRNHRKPRFSAPTVRRWWALKEWTAKGFSGCLGAARHHFKHGRRLTGSNQPSAYPPVSSNMACWKIHHLWKICLLKPPFTWDFLVPCLSTEGYRWNLLWVQATPIVAFRLICWFIVCCSAWFGKVQHFGPKMVSVCLKNAVCMEIWLCPWQSIDRSASFQPKPYP